MKKIGILTFHKSINYGAFMQCYSLAQKLKSDFPETKIEVIDYATERVFRNYSTNVFNFVFGTKEKNEGMNFLQLAKQSVSGILKLIQDPFYLNKLNVRKKSFEMSWPSLPLSDYSLVSDDYSQFFADVKGKYDAIVVGSDCVWRLDAYGFPNAYFLNADLGTKKLSYAASSHISYYPRTNDFERNYVKEAWNDFSYLGIRDISTQNFIREIDRNLKIFHNCDPTILLNTNEISVEMRSLKEKLMKVKIDLSKPIIGLMCDESVGRLVRDIFGKKYQVVAVYQPNKYANVYLPDLTPLEWAKIFSLFSITFTNYFHGTLLSLKNSTPVISFDNWRSCGDGHITRLFDLYNRLELHEHYFLGKDDYSNDRIVIKKRAIDFMENPPKEKIKAALEKEAQNYNSFKQTLQKIIKETF